MITKEDEAAYWRWMTTPNMKLTEAFALYRLEIEKRLSGKNNEVRNYTSDRVFKGVRILTGKEAEETRARMKRAFDKLKKPVDS